MPTRDTAPNGAPCWVELMTSDHARARDFYGQVLGWTSNEPSDEFGGYFMFENDGVPVAGGMPTMPDAGPPNVWSIYLSTDDADKAVEAATANGGQVIAPAMDVADLGRMAVVVDPGGAAIGMWQPNTFGGFTVLAEPGTPGWFELLTREYQASVDFYRTVFGWDTRTMSDTDDFKYTTANDGDTMLAGLMDATAFLPEGVPAHWSVYFATADTDATIAKLTELGGSVEQPAEDTPYGRIAKAADPMGARFKLVGPNEQMPAT
ncbi:MAG TPA: VOC family protein [Acidimicrobiales bacterium]|nr:VOC family protein [Acidimicrobiales bacterium]